MNQAASHLMGREVVGGAVQMEGFGGQQWGGARKVHVSIISGKVAFL